MSSRLFVIGDLSALPDTVRKAIEARSVERLDQAETVVAICPQDRTWPERLWSQLRQAHQELGLRVRGCCLCDGHSRKPAKPWPNVEWAFQSRCNNIAWYTLSNVEGGFDPGSTTLLFGKHEGSPLSEVSVLYLDWLLGQDWLEPESFLGRMLRLYLGRLARVHLEPLEREPFDVRPFVPSDSFVGAKAFRRSPTSLAAEDAWIDQHLGLIPRAEGVERKAKSRTLRAKIDDEWTYRGDDPPARVHDWERFLDALERMEQAPDLEQLAARKDEAERWLKVLKRCEGSELQSLVDEVESAYERRRQQLSDEEPNLDEARAEQWRRCFRGCRTREELRSVAVLVRNHASELSEKSLDSLRRLFQAMQFQFASVSHTANGSFHPVSASV